MEICSLWDQGYKITISTEYLLTPKILGERYSELISPGGVSRGTPSSVLSEPHRDYRAHRMKCRVLVLALGPKCK